MNNPTANTPPSSTGPESRPQQARRRPPMLNLDNQGIKASPMGQTPPSATLGGVNLANINRNTATTTTTLLGTPSSAIFPALRTPKDIVLQDIAVQCISPALPSFGSSVLDAMARSKTIQEEQRKLIAQRMMDEDENTGPNPLSGSPKATSSASPKASEKRPENKTEVIVSENGDIIIEAVPTPTEARLNVDQLHQSSMKSNKRKARPNRIELFPFSSGPSIHSAPLRRAPYSPNVFAQTARRGVPVHGGVNGATGPAAAAALHYPRPVRAQVPAGAMTSVPGTQLGNRGPGWPQFSNAYRGRPLRPVEDDDEEDDGRDPEDAALSDADEPAPPSAGAASAGAAGAAGGAKSKVDTVREEDEEGSEIEDRAIAEEDERRFDERRAKRRFLEKRQDGFNQVMSVVTAAVKTSKSNSNGNGNGNNSKPFNNRKRSGADDGLKTEQLKKQRFMELCSELWDVFRD